MVTNTLVPAHLNDIPDYYRIHIHPKEKSMKSNVGVWIDHKKAVIVRIHDGVEEMHSLDSDMEQHVRYSGGKPEDQQEHRFTNHLKEYYAKVIALLHDADSILILGPGEAKGELQTRLGAESSGAHIVGVETVDKMTDHQIAAKVRQHFTSAAEDIHQSTKP
jgi:stalled ribosome rescue protein Dom34